MDIYAPLAARIGMQRVKRELEDLAFAELDPDGRAIDRRRARTTCASSGERLVPADRGRADQDACGGRHRRPRSRAARRRPIRSGARCSTRTSRFEQLVRHHGLPRHRGRRRRSATTRWACIHGRWQVRAGAVQGLHLDPQAERLPLAAHRRDRSARPAHRECRSAPRRCTRSAERGVAAHWGYKQGGPARPTRRQYAWLRSLIDILEQGAERRGVPRAHQARDVPGPGVLLHAQGRADRAAAAARRRSTSPMPCTPRSATPASAPRSTAACCRCAPSSPTATRSRSSPRRRRRRRRPGNASSSPARPGPRSAASSARASAQQYLRARQVAARQDVPRGGLRGHREGGSTACAPTSSRPTDRRSDRRGRRGPRHAREVIDGGLSRPEAAAAQDGGADVVPISRARTRRRPTPRPRRTGGSQIAIRGLIPGMAVHFARCCHPLPGDRIVGIITTGKGVTIHTIDCATLESFSEAPERWIDVGWDSVSEGAPASIPAGSRSRWPTSRAACRSLSTVIARHERQHLEPAHRQPLDGFLRHGDRRRGAPTSSIWPTSPRRCAHAAINAVDARALSVETCPSDGRRRRPRAQCG